MFGRITLAAERRKRRAIQYRRPLKFAHGEGWNYVHEQLLDLKDCEPGQFSTIAATKVSPGKEVAIRLCCPKGSFMLTQDSKRVGCFAKPTGGPRIATPKAQVLLHEVEKFKFRHPEVWRALQKQPAKEIVTRAVSVLGKPFTRRSMVKELPGKTIYEIMRRVA